jgi:hypothetical protein
MMMMNIKKWVNYWRNIWLLILWNFSLAQEEKLEKTEAYAKLIDPYATDVDERGTGNYIIYSDN